MISITILCSDKEHPIYPKLEQWKKDKLEKFDVELISSVSELKESRNILFLISCVEIVKQEHRNLFDFSLVIHASDLPHGRGWSPHVWTILEGKNQITVSLLNAEDKVDSGDIWKKERISLDGTELFDEINEVLFKTELELMSWAVENIFDSTPERQKSECETYYRKRGPQDSILDVNKSLKEQFNLLRVCDDKRYPAYFYINNQRYNIKIEKE